MHKEVNFHIYYLLHQFSRRTFDIENETLYIKNDFESIEKATLLPHQTILTNQVL